MKTFPIAALLAFALSCSAPTAQAPAPAAAAAPAAAVPAPAPPPPAPPAAPVPAATGPAFQQSAEGVVSIEAEHFKSSFAATHAWTEITDQPDLSGGAAMRALPDQETVWNKGDEILKQAPRIDFLVRFVKEGPHFVWIRGRGLGTPAGSSDSVHLGLDGAVFAPKIRVTKERKFLWTSTTQAGAPITLTLPKPGTYTLNIWAREDGAAVDKIVISTAPDPVGAEAMGPPESPRAE